MLSVPTRSKPSAFVLGSESPLSNWAVDQANKSSGSSGYGRLQEATEGRFAIKAEYFGAAKGAGRSSVRVVLAFGAPARLSFP